MAKEEVYEVDEILDHKVSRSKVLTYLVSWKGYPLEKDRTWQAKEDLVSAPLIVRDYWKSVEESRKWEETGIKPTNKRKRVKEEQSVTQSNGKKAKVVESESETELEEVHSTTESEEDAEPAVIEKETGDVKESEEYEENEESVEESDEEDDDVPAGYNLEGREASDHADKKYKSLKSWEKVITSIDTVYKHRSGLRFFVLWKDDTYSWVPVEVASQKSPQHVIKFFLSHLKFTQRNSGQIAENDADEESESAVETEEDGNEGIVEIEEAETDTVLLAVPGDDSDAGKSEEL